MKERRASHRRHWRTESLFAANAIESDLDNPGAGSARGLSISKADAAATAADALPVRIFSSREFCAFRGRIN
jgi:hypothetical protein